MFTWFNFKLKICFGSRATSYLFIYDKKLIQLIQLKNKNQI